MLKKGCPDGCCELLPDVVGLFGGCCFSLIVSSGFSADFVFVAATQRATPQSPPPPPKPPSPNFELGLSSFPPLPGAAGQLKTDGVFENRLASKEAVGTTKELVNADGSIKLFHLCSWNLFCK